MMNDLNNRTLTIERTFNAPLKVVWEAWSQPEHIAQWWGPKGMETKAVNWSIHLAAVDSGHGVMTSRPSSAGSLKLVRVFSLGPKVVRSSEVCAVYILGDCYLLLNC